MPQEVMAQFGILRYCTVHDNDVRGNDLMNRRICFQSRTCTILLLCFYFLLFEIWKGLEDLYQLTERSVKLMNLLKDLVPARGRAETRT